MKIFILISGLIFTTNLIADSRSFDRTWLGLFNKKVVSKNYSIWTEAQARMDNDKFTNQQLLLRAGVLKSLNENSEIGLIYGHIQTDDLREHRPTLQYNYTFSSSLLLRNRIEYRKLENNDAVSGRYRAMIRYQNGSLVIWEEPFLTFTNEDWTGNRIFERNRFFVGSSLKLAETKLEIGYMNQFTPRSGTSTIEHILTLYLFY